MSTTASNAARIALMLASLSPQQKAYAETVILTTCIAEIESGNNHAAIGDNGAARGAWQMHKAAWETANYQRMQKGLKPWGWDTHWKDKRVQLEMAVAYVSWLKDELEASKHFVKVGPKEVYMAYAFGLQAYKDVGYVWKLCPPAKQNAAERVENVYHKLGGR